MVSDCSNHWNIAKGFSIDFQLRLLWVKLAYFSCSMFHVWVLSPCLPKKCIRPGDCWENNSKYCRYWFLLHCFSNKSLLGLIFISYSIHKAFIASGRTSLTHPVNINVCFLDSALDSHECLVALSRYSKPSSYFVPWLELFWSQPYRGGIACKTAL